MRVYDPLVSLPYWNWEVNPTLGAPLITSPRNGTVGWLGNDEGRVGAPFEFLDNNGVFEGSWEDGLDNPADPPEVLDRYVKSLESPLDYGIVPDATILSQSTFAAMRFELEQNAHDRSHGYLCGGGEVFGRRSPMDPMFWLLHTNCDRIWAAWQLADPARMNAATAYGVDDDLPESALNGNIQPWSGGTAIRPWTAPDNQINMIGYKDASILVPRFYR